MQVVLIGAVHRQGVGSKSGNPYDFGVLMVLTPVSERGTDKMKVTGCGYQVAEIRCSKEVVQQASKLGAPFPLKAVLTIGNEIGEFGQMQSVCNGVVLDRAGSVTPQRAA